MDFNRILLNSLAARLHTIPAANRLQAAAILGMAFDGIITVDAAREAFVALA